MSAAHEGHEERATEAPSWYSQCEGLLHLFTDHGVDVSNTWGREGSVASCCGFDGSDDNARRQVVCDDANGRINAIHWTNEVNGDIRSFDLSALTNLETVDLSGSKGLIGEFPGWMFALKGLKSLNLSGTSISGRLPKLTSALPELAHVSFSNSAISGPVPSEAPKECDLSGTSACVINPAQAGACNVQERCALGVLATPDAPASDGKPGAVGPSYGGKPPLTPDEQCKVLKTWLVGHGMDPLLLWSDEQSCCPYWHPATMDHFMPHDVEVTCIQDYGIGHIRFQSAGLHGDINDASERMDMLTGVRSFVVNNNADLTGNFPTFLTKLPDLFSIGLSHTGLEGPMPDLRGLPNLVVLNTDGTEFSGPLPPSKKLQDTGLSYSAPSFLSCSISSEHSELCWLYDKSEYDPKCLDSNPSIRTCGTAAPVMTSMVSSVASPAMSATTFNASSPAAKLMPTSSSISSQPSSSPAPSVAFLTDASNNNSTVGSEPSQAYLGGLIGGVIGGILIFILVAVFLIRKLNKPNATVSVASAPSKSHKNHSHGHHGKLKRSLSAKGSSLSVDTIATAQSQSFADSLVSPTTMMGRHA